MPEFLYTLLVLSAILTTIAFVKYRNLSLHHKAMAMSHYELKASYRELKSQFTSYEREQKTLETSKANLSNGLAHVSGGKGKHQSYVHDLKNGQTVCIVYSLKQPFLSSLVTSAGELMPFDVLQHVNQQGFELDCVAFIDERTVSPFATEYISEADSVFRFDIDLTPFTGRGLGTFVMKDLFDFLERHTKIETVVGKLSFVDYPRRESLYKFYRDHCGFAISKQMTETSSGAITYRIPRS